MEENKNIIAKLEKLGKEIENEKNFDRALQMFTEATGLIKQALHEGRQQKGKITEIVREVDEFIEKELKDEKIPC